MNIFKSRLWFILVILASCTSAAKEEAMPGETKAEAIDRLMTFSNENGMFNGTLLVASGDSVIYRKALGLADFDSEQPLTPETAFYLASVSKQFTTMAIMILHEEGRLGYDDKLSEYFSEFPAYAQEVTIRHLMTHTSGIPDHYRLNAYKKGLNNADVFEILLQQEALDFPPGEQYSYSNGGYVLLSMIVEKVSGMPFHLYMKENVFDKLDMQRTLVYDLSEPVVENRAVGYNSGLIDDYEIFTTGAGGMYSTVDDLYRWHKGLAENVLVSAATLEEAYRPFILNSGDTSYYGYGWGLFPDGKKVSHSGGLNGFRTYLQRYPDSGDAFILLTNNGFAFNFEITEKLDQILEGEAFTLPKVPVSNKLLAYLDMYETDSALLLTDNLMNDSMYVQDEFGINRVGYSSLTAGDIAKAVAIFEFNTRYFPGSANAYDSYAEALLANGDTAASIQNYKKSLEQNPANQNAVEILTSLGFDKDELVPQVHVDESILALYTGKYELEPEFFFEITTENGRLFVTPTGQDRSEIFPTSDTKFYSKIADAQITFHRDATGNVTKLTLHQGGDTEALKIE